MFDEDGCGAYSVREVHEDGCSVVPGRELQEGDGCASFARNDCLVMLGQPCTNPVRDVLKDGQGAISVADFAGNASPKPTPTFRGHISIKR